MHRRTRINVDSYIIFILEGKTMLQCDINVFLRHDTQSRKGTLLSESMLGFQFLTEATGDGGRPFAEGSLLIWGVRWILHWPDGLAWTICVLYAQQMNFINDAKQEILTNPVTLQYSLYHSVPFFTSSSHQVSTSGGSHHWLSLYESNEDCLYFDLSRNASNVSYTNWPSSVIPGRMRKRCLWVPLTGNIVCVTLLLLQEGYLTKSEDRPWIMEGSAGPPVSASRKCLWE